MVLTIVLIFLSLTLAALTGMQFFYMLILDRRDREQKTRIRQLEKRCIQLAKKINNPSKEDVSEEEVWAEVIHDDRV
ncbi:MAG: hypothetical protein ACKN97_05010 [Acidobacteriota bacterium]